MVMEILLDILCHADFSGRLRKTPDSPGIAAFAAKWRAFGREIRAVLFCSAPGMNFRQTSGAGSHCRCHEPSEDGCPDLGNPEFDRGPEFLEDCIAGLNSPCCVPM